MTIRTHHVTGLPFCCGSVFCMLSITLWVTPPRWSGVIVAALTQALGTSACRASGPSEVGGLNICCVFAPHRAALQGQNVKARAARPGWSAPQYPFPSPVWASHYEHERPHPKYHRLCVGLEFCPPAPVNPGAMQRVMDRHGELRTMLHVGARFGVVSSTSRSTQNMWSGSAVLRLLICL